MGISQICTTQGANIEASPPIWPDYRRLVHGRLDRHGCGRRLGRSELIPTAASAAPTLDPIAVAVVNPGEAKPASVRDLANDSQRVLTKCADVLRRKRPQN